MTTTAIRQRLHEYIRFADEKKVKAIYTEIASSFIFPAFDEEKTRLWISS